MHKQVIDDIADRGRPLFCLKELVKLCDQAASIQTLEHNCEHLPELIFIVGALIRSVGSPKFMRGRMMRS